MKKEWKKPFVRVIELKGEDIIVTSDPRITGHTQNVSGDDVTEQSGWMDSFDHN